MATITESLRKIENQLFEERDEYHDLVGAYLSEGVDKEKLWEMLKNNDIEQIVEFLENDADVEEEPDEYHDLTPEEMDYLDNWQGIQLQVDEYLNEFIPEENELEEIIDISEPYKDSDDMVYVDVEYDARDEFGDSVRHTMSVPLDTDKLHLVEGMEDVTVGIYGDEVQGFHSVDELVNHFIKKGIKVSDVDGDMDYGWEMNLTGDPRQLFFAVVNVIPGYNSDSVEEFIDQYKIDESLKEDVFTPNDKKILAKKLVDVSDNEVENIIFELRSYDKNLYDKFYSLKKDGYSNAAAAKMISDILMGYMNESIDNRVGQRYKISNGVEIEIHEPTKNGRVQYCINNNGNKECRDTDSYETLDKILNKNGYVLCESTLTESDDLLADGSLQNHLLDAIIDAAKPLVKKTALEQYRHLISTQIDEMSFDASTGKGRFVCNLPDLTTRNATLLWYDAIANQIQKCLIKNRLQIDEYSGPNKYSTRLIVEFCPLDDDIDNLIKKLQDDTYKNKYSGGVAVALSHSKTLIKLLCLKFGSNFNEKPICAEVCMFIKKIFPEVEIIDDFVLLLAHKTGLDEDVISTSGHSVIKYNNILYDFTNQQYKDFKGNWSYPKAFLNKVPVVFEYTGYQTMYESQDNRGKVYEIIETH